MYVCVRERERVFVSACVCQCVGLFLSLDSVPLQRVLTLFFRFCFRHNGSLLFFLRVCVFFSVFPCVRATPRYHHNWSLLMLASVC